MTTLFIVLSLLGANAHWSDDAYRFRIADQHPTQTARAVEIVQDLDCVVFEDLTATCEKGAN